MCILTGCIGDSHAHWELSPAPKDLEWAGGQLIPSYWECLLGFFTANKFATVPSNVTSTTLGWKQSWTLHSYSSTH